MSGLLIFAPCGSGKSYLIERAPKELHVEDGDTILEEMGVKNRNYFWYESKKVEQRAIRACLNKALARGANVLYSGNPLIWKPDIIYLPPEALRWKNLSGRKGFRPTPEQFKREQIAYEEASEEIETVTSIQELVSRIEGASSQ